MYSGNQLGVLIARSCKRRAIRVMVRVSENAYAILHYMGLHLNSYYRTFAGASIPPPKKSLGQVPLTQGDSP